MCQLRDVPPEQLNQLLALWFVDLKHANVKKQKATANQFMDWACGKGDMRQLRDVPPEQLDQL